ncbi:DUF7500 family protein [Natrinema halophilum]|uniref:Uncharacterized protein n=1 Tax=Natrinema halophilum TaxID=1699371 RepID=A0A7D5KZH7_9EURY|nr:hypothetical protein [Natrinema halophilum]QLG49260.1 hypothetical protein HYG82_10520 [Natrinema halophilum]
MTPDPLEQDDGVLAPDELRLDDDHVDELGENRYLVRSEGAGSKRVARPPATEAVDTPPAGDLPAGDGHTESDHHARTPHAHSSELADASEPHGVDITLKTDREIAHHRATSHDVREVFVDLLTWYAGQLDDDLSPSEALQVMLAASDLEV